MVNSNFFLEICCKHNTLLESVNIHYSGAFYSILYLFILKIFRFNWASVFVRYFGSISRFSHFIQLWIDAVSYSQVVLIYIYVSVHWFLCCACICLCLWYIIRVLKDVALSHIQPKKQGHENNMGRNLGKNKKIRGK